MLPVIACHLDEFVRDGSSVFPCGFPVALLYWLTGNIFDESMRQGGLIVAEQDIEKTCRTGRGLRIAHKALDLTTPTGRAMAGLLSVFATFEHEILRQQIRAVSVCFNE